jgi:hypothetical protein
MIVINHINSMLARRGWLPYVLVVGLYSLMRLPDVLVVTNYAALVGPLTFFYLSRLLFDGLAVRPDIALTVISPSNMSLIAPPGIFVLNALSSKVSSLYWTLFVFQLAVGPLFYRLMTKVTSRAGALLLALLATYYFTRSNWWTPDFLIQPLMLFGVLLLLSPQFRRDAVFHLILLGQIVGLVIVFKHNIGVFFAILCGTQFFLDAFRQTANPRQPSRMMAAGILLIGFFAFIPVFGARLLFLDEWLFYLLPYAAFWMSFAVFLRQGSLVFDLPRFLKKSAVFSASALLLPGVLFIAFGSVIGYGRYWHSLFGMGFKFLPIWDRGILNEIAVYLSARGVANIYNSLVVTGLFLLPLAVNLFAVWSVGRVVVSGQWGGRRKLALFRMAGLGVMGILMFFPLEGYHILSTKLFLFVFVAAYFLRRFHPRTMVPIGCVLALMLLPMLVLGGYRAVSALRMETESGSPVLQRKIGVAMQKDIAVELSRQVEVIQRSVRGQSYFVVDSSGGTLIGLAALEDNGQPQYYVEMRPGIFDREVVEAIKIDLAKRPYLIVNSDDYAHRNDAGVDPSLHEIISFIDEHFVLTDRYTKLNASSDTTSQIRNFLIMRRR